MKISPDQFNQYLKAVSDTIELGVTLECKIEEILDILLKHSFRSEEGIIDFAWIFGTKEDFYDYSTTTFASILRGLDDDRQNFRIYAQHSYDDELEFNFEFPVSFLNLDKQAIIDQLC